MPLPLSPVRALFCSLPGWAQGYMWVGLALFYGGFAQFVAGMWEFKNQCQFGATAFSTYGAFWMSQGFLLLLEQMKMYAALRPPPRLSAPPAYRYTRVYPEA